MPHTILLADDSKTIQRAVEIVFEKESDFDLVSVSSGADAIARAREISPAIVIADHAMPGGGGLEVASALRGDPATSTIPILVLSGSSQPFDADGATRLGVQHLQKPFDSVSLLDRVQRLCGLKAADAPPPSPFAHLRPAGSSAVATPAAATPATAPAPAAVAPVPPAPATPPVSPFGPPPSIAAAASSPVSPFGAPPASSFPAADADGPAVASPSTAPVSPFGPPPEVMSPSDPVVESSPPMPEQAPSPFLDATAVLDRSALGLTVPMTPESLPPVPAAATPLVEVASAAVVKTFEAATAAVVETASAALAPASESGPSNEAISAAAREIIERVVWEVVPELAETLIREEIARLMHERRA